MATLTLKLRGISKSSHSPVYVMVTHKSKIAYIRTNIMCPNTAIKNGEIKDKQVLIKGNNHIASLYAKLENMPVKLMDVRDIVSVLNGEDEITFTEFANSIIEEYRRNGKRYSNIMVAVKKIHKYIGRDVLLFSDITPSVISGWIETLKDTKAAKAVYPHKLGLIFNKAMKYLNKPQFNKIVVKYNPVNYVDIPIEETPEKRGVTPDKVKSILSYKFDYPSDAPIHQYMDVLMLVFCLAGINVADLYDLKKSNFDGEYITYNRGKTKAKRKDNALLRIRLPEQAKEAFERLRDRTSSEYLLTLHNHSVKIRYTQNMIATLKRCTSEAGIEHFTSYTFRHSWATIARNEVGASMDDVAFALNHSSGHAITDKYVKPDFSRIDKLNDKVLELVFEKK